MSVKILANIEPSKEDTEESCFLCQKITYYWAVRYIDEMNLSLPDFKYESNNPLHCKVLCHECAEKVKIFCFICNNLTDEKEMALVEYRTILEPKGFKCDLRTKLIPCVYGQLCYVCIDCCKKNKIIE